MDLKKIEEMLQPYLKEHDLIFDDIELVKEFGYLILRISIDREGGIDVNTLAECNEYISEKIDSIDLDMPEYMLEVCSPGAEKKLNSLDEIRKYISHYVHVEVPNMIYEGTLESVIENIVEIKYNAKGRFKKIKIAYEDISLIRLAVKI